MQQITHPVDVICACMADGKITPLRLRVEDETRQLQRIDIEEVISMQSIQHVGMEAQVFMCRAHVNGKRWFFELKYSLRTHSWCLLRRIYGGGHQAYQA